jgi:ATP-dependent helicase/nuclease subunit B
VNRLTKSLVDVCTRNLLAEKWLIAPSRRVGHQWLEAVARSGTPVVNVHVKTPTSLAVDLAAQQMAARGLTLLSPRGGAFLVDRIVRRLQNGGLQYLAQLEPSAGLSESIYGAITAIRLAGLDSEALSDDRFEVAGKGHDLRTALQEYLAELELGHLIDGAGLLRMAVERIHADAASLPGGLLVLVPADMECNCLEQKLIEAIPAQRRHTLPIDELVDKQDTVATDLQLLRWLEDPLQAPAPKADGSVRIRRAVGEVNEVRDVLRRCLSGKVRFDDVELLHTNVETYVPLAYETFLALGPDGATLGDGLPVTFAEGIPCRYSRPGRALAMWLAWIAEDYPQRSLVQMLHEGLLEVPQASEGKTSYGRLAGLLRGVGIGFGRDRYRGQIQERIAALTRQIDEPPETADDEDEPHPDRRANIEHQIDDLKSLDALCEALLACAPAATSKPIDLLAGATKFLTTLARSVNQIDRFAVNKLVSDVSDAHRWLSLYPDSTGFVAQDWLAHLPGEARVLGSGPRPGCLHVAHVGSGGHSGRPYTFIVGLDDSRFPGSGLQDPLLLDSERRQLSPNLEIAASRLENKLRDFTRLLARLRGQLTLSFCARSVDDDRELFPSAVVLVAYRLISGKHDGDQSDLAAWMAAQSAPASFAPHDPAECLSASEWWLWRLCGSTTVHEPEALVLAHFPHLARGRHAAAQRRLSEFTEYDGRVEQAGPDLDPTRPDHQVLSANRLQKIGKCPLMYFFEYGLGITAPEELEVNPAVWLDALAAGSLLHELFEQFMRELLVKELVPSFTRDEKQLRELFAAQIARYKQLYPAPSASVFQRQRTQLEQAALTFLREEESYCVQQNSRPVYVEVSLGMPAEEHGTTLDTLEAVPVNVGGGRQIRLRGRVDRIDLVGSGAVQTFAVWDYKTGSSWAYDRANPLQQGRVLQPYLYVTMVTHRLREKFGSDAAVTQFGFFFPGAKAQGERIVWTREDLAAGREIIEKLVQLVSNGAFLATDNHEDDCTYCDYKGVCGDVEALAAASKLKLGVLDNHLLTPLREVRHG